MKFGRIFLPEHAHRLTGYISHFAPASGAAWRLKTHIVSRRLEVPDLSRIRTC